MPLDRAVLSFEWSFDAVSDRRTRITQRIILSGDNATAYAPQVRDSFGLTLVDGMKRIARRDGQRRAFNGGKPMTFPTPVPEIPAANVDKAAAYYVNTLGFTFDWGDEQGGVAGISRGNCRLFLTNRSFRESYGNTGPSLFWLNLDGKSEVDELFAEWKAAQAKIISEPEDKPWKLREFMAADLDGNLIRVFYDFRWDV